MSRPFKLRPPRISENDVEAGCKTILALHQYWVIRLHAGVYQTLDGRRHVRGVPKGTPDYACLMVGIAIFCSKSSGPAASFRPTRSFRFPSIRKSWDVPVVAVETVNQLVQFPGEARTVAVKNKGRVSSAPPVVAITFAPRERNPMAQSSFLIVTKELLADKRLSATAKLLLATLREYRNKQTGQCNPWETTLAAAMGVSSRHA